MLQNTDTAFTGIKADKHKISGAELLINALDREKVEVIFGYPGGAVLPIYDKIYDSKILHILPRHEQGGIHAAEGYARISGKPGVVIATSGPGATNIVTGIADAMMDSLPLSCLHWSSSNKCDWIGCFPRGRHTWDYDSDYET